MPSLTELRADCASIEGGIGFVSDPSLFDVLGLKLAFSMRDGGKSSEPWNSLNLGLNVGDDPSCVQANRLLVLEALGLSAYADRLVNPLQVHGEAILTIVDDNSNLSRLEKEAEIAEVKAKVIAAAEVHPQDILQTHCDAVVCTQAGIPVLLCFADCVPIIIVAPDGSFAVVHSGWRGALKSIAGKAVTLLSIASNCSPSDMNAYIGPHIGSCCYEVSPEMIDSFVSEFGSGCDAMCGHLDLGYAVESSLLASGMDIERIIESELCVADNTDKFFSHRAEGGKTGRFGAICCKTTQA